MPKEKKKEKVEIDAEDLEEVDAPPESLLKEPKKDYEIEDKSATFQLEYFSKDELTDKVKELSKTVEEQTSRLKVLEEEKANFNKRFMLQQAEFENAHKRWDKSRQNLRTQYIASVLKNFLALYDSFKKAIDSKTEENQKEIESITQFFNQFLNVFKSYQAEPIETKKQDPFDYNIHEALTTIENDDLPENSIVDIIQEGWKIGKEILRYAKVVISKKPKPPEPEPKPTSDESEDNGKEINENQEEKEDTDDSKN